MTTIVFLLVCYEEEVSSALEKEPPMLDKFLSRFRLSELPRLPTTMNALHGISAEYANYLNLLEGKIITAEMIGKYLDDPQYFYKMFKIAPIKNINMTEKGGIIANIYTLILYSNITPFRSKNRGMKVPCYYCSKSFDNLEQLRDHQNQTHDRREFQKIATARNHGAEKIVINVDVTDLKCTICEENIANITDLKTHLIRRHNKNFYEGYSNRLVPYKLSDTDIFECQICGFNFETFGYMERHMNGHFRNYVCTNCGAGFVTKYRLKIHVKHIHEEGVYTCSTCNKTFPSPTKLKGHINAVHKLAKRFKCTKCAIRFTEYLQRQRHMVLIHNMVPIRYKCNVCAKDFDRRYTLSRHMKRDHLEERDFECEFCLYKCFSSSELKFHMVKHIGERIYECAVCKKSYARKKTLREHMRIHNNDRRFACTVCGVTFVQKCSLKGHIKTHHQQFNISD